MKKELLNELNQMKYLFGYKPGRVISEQEINEAEMEMSDVEFDFPEVAPAPDKEKTKEKEKPKTKNPFKIEPAQKPGPKGRAPKWLSFDTFTKLGYNLK